MPLSQNEVDLTDYRWQVQFIFGASTYRILNLRNNLCQDNLGRTSHRQTFAQEFENIVAAMLETGIASKGDKILCTTWPEGSQRFDASGTA